MDVLERATHEIGIFEKPSKETCLKMCEEITRLRQLVFEAEVPNPMDPYTRIVFFFDEDQTAGSFLREDGDGGFTGAIYRMAREIDRLRQLLSEADKREAEARKKLQAMHRRAQESERVEQMIFDTLGTWHKLYNEGQFKPRARRALFFVVMKVLKSRSEKIRHRRAALERSEG